MSQWHKIKDRTKRFFEVLKFRASGGCKYVSPSGKNQLDSRITFLIAHFNSPEFLSVCLDAIRKHHPESRILVADATSDWSSYCAAKEQCKRYSAQMWPLMIPHRHSGILNFLFRHAETELAVFLDQDCILLDRLDSICAEVQEGVLLAGPKDQMLLDYQLRSGLKPELKPKFLRDYPDYIHASLMVLQPAKVRAFAGNSPFTWKAEFGDHQREKYHGLSHQLKTSSPDRVLALPSQHSAYGLGMVYFHKKNPVAYHNWYSGRVFKQEGRIDGLAIDSLKNDQDRFLADYWAQRLNFRIQPEAVR